MKNIYLLALAALFSFEGVAQNFQAIQDNGYRIYNFGYQRGIDVDSTAVADGDSIFYLTPSVQEQDPGSGCYTPFGPSWMGSHVRISPDGTHLFFNLQGDTIRIEAQAPVGTSWIAYESPLLTVMCEVVSAEETDIFEGLADIVKTISFQAVDADLNPIDHSVNALEIKLSENYGFVKTVNFVAFPVGTEWYLYQGLGAAALLGIEGFDGSIQNLLNREIFDFQPGDELHVRDYYTSVGGREESRTIYSYLTRIDYPDSIVYTMQVDRDNYYIEFGEDPVQTGFLSEIQSQVIKASPTLDQLPLSPFVNDIENQAYSNYYKQSGSIVRQKSTSGWPQLYLDVFDGCWLEIIDGGCSNFFSGNFEYTEKRGGPYYVCGTMFSPYGRELVYFNVDGQEGGTPFQLILNAETVAEADFRIYPNPAIDKIFIETGEVVSNSRIEISGIQGRVILTETLAGSRSEIQVGTLPAGVFIYRVYGGETVLKTGKILIQR